MKTLSIQQPWAQLIASGIKEVENRTWATKHRGKILIHASSKKVTASWYKKTFIEWAQVTANHQFFGNIPYDDELPTCAIIGYVEVVDCEEGATDGYWDGFPEDVKWRLKDAYLFDEPILDVKGKLNLFEYDLDENNLPPAHKVELRFPFLDGNTLVIPVSEADIDELSAADMYEFGLVEGTDYINQIFPEPGSDQMADIKQLRFVYGDKSVTRDVADACITLDVDKNDKPVEGYSLFSPEPDFYRNVFFQLA